MEFLKYVVSDLYDKFNGDFRDVTIVLPTRRAGLFVKDYLSNLEQVACKPVYAPECTTISDLFDSLCRLKPVDEIKAVCLLYKVYQKYTANLTEKQKQMTLDCFYGWGRQLIADFNNVDKNSVDSPVSNIFESSMDARKFDKTVIDREVRLRIEGLIKGTRDDVSAEANSYYRNFESIWNNLLSIYNDFTKVLADEGYAMEGARCKWVVDRFDEVWPEIEGRKFVFAGFNILLSTEQALMEKLKTKDAALFYWDYDEEFKAKETHINAYNRVAWNIHTLGGDYENSHDADKKIKVVAATSDNAQARYVYKWLNENYQPGKKIGIVLCNETMLQPVVFSIPEKLSGQVNITKGFPLRNTQVFAQILSWFDDSKNTSGSFLEVMKRLLAYIDEQFAGLSENAVGEGTAWYQLLARESHYQARCVIVRFIQLIEDGTLGDIEHIYTLCNLLENHLSSISIPFHGEPVTDVQVIGVLETRTLDFDKLLLLNVEEGVLPMAGSDNSFIPYYLRKYYGLTTNDEQNEVYAYNFFRLLRRAADITILYSEAQTAEGQKSMSRFVMQILTSNTMRSCISRHILTENSATVSPLSEDEIQDSLIKCSEFRTFREVLLDRKAKSPGKDLRLSPSAINMYLSCKMKFFLRHIRGLQEPVDGSKLLAANDLGTLIHESVRASYKKIAPPDGTGPVDTARINAFLQNPKNIEDAVVAAYAAMNDDYRARHSHGSPSASPLPDIYLPEEHPIESAVARKHLENVLRYDSTLTGFHIVGNEEKKYYTYPVAGVGDLKLGGSIDRLDVVTENGQRVLRIVDYKTGHFDKAKMRAASIADLFKEGTKQGYVLQTMLYSLACMSDTKLIASVNAGRVMPILLFTQKNLKNFDSSLEIREASDSRKYKPIEDFAAYQAVYEEELKTIVNEIIDQTKFPMTPIANVGHACKNCPFVQLCGREKEASAAY